MNKYYMGSSPKNYSGGGYIDKKNVMSSDKNRLKAIQLDLKSKGFYTGRIDGIYGPLTAKAIDSYNYDVDLRNPAKENAIYGQKTSGAPFFQNMGRESTNVAQFPQMQGGSDWAPSSMNMMDTYGLYGNSNTVGKDYVTLGRQSVNTTSPRGLEESGKTILSVGSKGQEVRELQKLLKEKGYYKDSVDGRFGQKTKEAVKAFQKDFNKNPNMLAEYVQDNKTYSIGRNWDSPTGYRYKPMIIDGIVGDQTRAALMAKDLGPRPPMGNPWENMLPSSVPTPAPYSRNYQVTDNRVMGEGDFFNAGASNALNALILGAMVPSAVTGAAAELGAAYPIGAGVGRQAAQNLARAGAAGFYRGGYIPFTNGGSLTNGREMAYSNGYAYGGSMYSLPQSAASYAEGGLVEQRMAESAMMNAMAANILAGRSNAMQTQPQQPVMELAPPSSTQAFVTPQSQNIQQPIQQAPTQQQTGPINVDEILSLPYKERRIAHHNPGNIKYGKFASKYGAVAGRKATDGGNIAIFPDWESGMKAKKDLLRSGGYKNLTLDEAMKRWSGYYVEPKPGHKRGGYGADRIAPQLASKKMVDMTEDELNFIMKKMAKIEDGDVYKVIYGKAMGGELPKSYAAGGFMDIAGAALSRGAQYAGQIQDIINPTVNPDEGDYKFNWGDALTKGGILMELAKKMSMDNARSKYVMGASPGNYAKGGMISKAKAREILHDGTVHGKPITEKQRRFFGAMASRADGGEIMNLINPSNNIDMLNQPNAIRALLTGNTNQPMKMGGVMNYASGGDMKLSDNSFLVDGNPSVTDGNFYPQLNAKLDHGEVVKDNFVFSNKLRDPQTNVTYAKLAQPVEKSTGKAEKFMRRFQNDVFSKNTVMQNNKFLDSLSNKQEVLATAMGLRQEQQPMGYAVGGQMDPNNPMYMSVSPVLYFDPISGNFKQRIANGNYINTKYELWADKNTRAQYNTGQDWINANAANINAFKQQHYPSTGATASQSSTTTAPVPSSPAFNPATTVNTPQPTPQVNPQGTTQSPALVDPFLPPSITTPKPTGTMPPKIDPNWQMSPVTPQQRQNAALGDIRSAQEQYEANKAMQEAAAKTEYDYQKYLASKNVLQPIDMLQRQTVRPLVGPSNDFTTGAPLGAYTDSSTVQVTSTTPRTQSLDKYAEELKKNPMQSSSKTDGMGQKWTVGDYLNAAAVAGRFGQLIGGPEVEKPVYDTTAITRQVYDPASALYQTNRQTAGVLNRMDVPSINARTSIANNMLAQRLNQDAQTLSSYQNMNAQALRDYETRATEQRRYNIGQTLATNQMNAQNRAAYKQAVDNAMTSLGGFGTAMNEKTQAYDMLNILKTMYPEVYRRIMSGEKVTLADSEAVKEATKAVQDATGATPKANAYGGKMKKGGIYGR